MIDLFLTPTVRRRSLTIARRMLRIPDDAEDAVQGAALRLHRLEVESYPIRSKNGLWFRLLAGACLDLNRRQERHRSEPLADHEDLIGAEDPLLDLLTRERHLHMRAVLDDLTNDLPDIFWIPLWATASDYSYSEIAAHAGIPTGTVKSRVSRAKRDIRRKSAGANRAPKEAELEPTH